MYQKREGALMKRIISCVLIMCISFGIPVAAKETITDTQKPEKVMIIEYDDLEDLVRDNNKTIQANKKLIKSLRIRDDIERRQQELNDAYGDLERLYDGLNEMGGALSSIPTYTPPAPPVEDLEGEEGEEEEVLPVPPSQADMALIGMKGVLGNLIYAISDLSNSMMSTVYDGMELLDIDDDYVDRVELQLEEIDDKIVMGSQLLYVAHEYMQLQLDDLERKQEVLDYNIYLADIKYQVGMATKNDLKNAKINQTPLNSAIETLQLEMDTLKDRISALIDLDYEVKKEFTPLPDVKSHHITMRNYNSDYNLARSENHTLEQKRKNLEIAKRRYDDKKYDSDKKSRKLTEESAQLSYEGALKDFDVAFKRVYNDIDDQVRLVEEVEAYYDMEAENYELAQLKYDEGFISKLDLMTAQDTFDLKKFELKQAKVNLLSAIEAYKWALRGNLDQPANPSK